MVKQQVEKSLTAAYTGRKDRKGEFRSVWTLRINAACRENGTTYSRFIAGLKNAGIALNRKMLSEIAISDMNSFKKLVGLAGSAAPLGKAASASRAKAGAAA